MDRISEYGITESKKKYSQPDNSCVPCPREAKWRHQEKTVAPQEQNLSKWQHFI